MPRVSTYTAVQICGATSLELRFFKISLVAFEPNEPFASTALPSAPDLSQFDLRTATFGFGRGEASVTIDVALTALYQSPIPEPQPAILMAFGLVLLLGLQSGGMPAGIVTRYAKRRRSRSGALG